MNAVTTILSTPTVSRLKGGTRRYRSGAAIVLVAALGLGLAACKTTPPPKPTGIQLSGAELTQAYMSGAAVVINGHSLKTGVKYVIERDGDGNQTFLNLGSKFADQGTYRVNGDQVCSKWKKIREGAEWCGTVYRLKDGSYEYADTDGNLGGTFTLSKPS